MRIYEFNHHVKNGNVKLLSFPDTSADVLFQYTDVNLDELQKSSHSKCCIKLCNTGQCQSDIYNVVNIIRR